MRIYIDVSDERKIELIKKWAKESDFEIVKQPPYDVVVVNFRPELPLSIYRLFTSVNCDALGALMHAILNHEDVLPLCDPEDYEEAIDYFEKAGDVPMSERRRLALKAMFHIISHFSKFHQRMGELFGMADFQHKTFQVVDSEYGNGYIIEAVTERPGRTRGNLLYPLLPIYLSVLNMIPEESFVVFVKGVPIYASLDPTELTFFRKGEVVVYRGDWNFEDERFVVASGGKADVLHLPSEEDELLYGTSSFSQRISREVQGLDDVERLAVAVISISPVLSAYLFDDKRTIKVSASIEKNPDLNDMGWGKILAISFPLEDPKACSKYERIIATQAPKEVKKVCGRKLLLRRF